MKSCPSCQRPYADETIKFCLEDGSLLVAGPGPTVHASAQPTLHLPGPTHQSPGATPTSPPSTMTSIGFQPPAASAGSPYPAEVPARKSPLLWIVIALIIGGSGIAIALILTRGRDSNTSGVPNSNLSSSPTPGQISSEPSPANTESSASTKLANTSQTRPTPALTNEVTNTKPPKTEVKEATPTPKPVPRGPISGGVLNGKAVRLVQPSYPAMARAANASGTVAVQVLIDESGNVTSAQAVSGHPLLRSSAVSAARASKFSPTLLGGVPVKVSGVINYNFQAQ